MKNKSKLKWNQDYFWPCKWVIIMEIRWSTDIFCRGCLFIGGAFFCSRSAACNTIDRETPERHGPCSHTVIYNDAEDWDTYTYRRTVRDYILRSLLRTERRISPLCGGCLVQTRQEGGTTESWLSDTLSSVGLLPGESVLRDTKLQAIMTVVTFHFGLWRPVVLPDCNCYCSRVERLASRAQECNIRLW